MSGVFMSDFLVAGLIVLALAAIMNAGALGDSVGCRPGSNEIVQVC